MVTHYAADGREHDGHASVCHACALERPCPACHVPPGHSCTAPTDTGRRNVPWVHLARERSQQ